MSSARSSVLRVAKYRAIPEDVKQYGADGLLSVRLGATLPLAAVVAGGAGLSVPSMSSTRSAAKDAKCLAIPEEVKQYIATGRCEPSECPRQN